MKITVYILSIFFSFSTSSQSIQGTSDNERPNILFMIADDWSFPHAGIYEDEVVRTPTFDQIGQMGGIFTNAYCAAPSCSPSRASILTSRYPHQLEGAGNLWSIIPDKFENWMTILAEAGYHTGKTRKGWGPGDYVNGGYEHNPAGKDFKSFEEFLGVKKDNEPFAFWFGSQDPHRAYEENAGVKTGMKAESITVPSFLPYLPCVRNDILDYYYEVERFDRECGNLLKVLEQEGLLQNTIVVMTSDNGMPFPRAKANLYDYGTRMPLVIYWKGHMEGGLMIDEFVNFIDFGPTFLSAANLEVPALFEGSDIQPLFDSGTEKSTNAREKVFLERERHANVRKGDLSYPMRAVRTSDYLYIRNYEPDRWPAGDPIVHQSVGQFGDVDNSISKFLVLDAEKNENYGSDLPYFDLSFEKRPYEELYVVSEDPYNVRNEIENPKYSEVLNVLRKELDEWMIRTGDLRSKEPRTTFWDEVIYTPQYQSQNYNLRAKIDEYKLLISEGGKFIESDCNF